MSVKAKFKCDSITPVDGDQKHMLEQTLNENG